ncbi:MAG: FAD-dependent oxidoreductase [Victivallales bacterium]|nr:FAD-dependent oxidoreductase [Victivallales bacterium]
MTQAVILGAGHAAAAAAEACKARGMSAVAVTRHGYTGGMLGFSRMPDAGPEGVYRKSLNERFVMTGTPVLFNTHCAGIFTAKNTVRGVLIANRFGTFLLEADLVIDATSSEVALCHLEGDGPRATRYELNFDITPVDPKAEVVPSGKNMRIFPTLKPEARMISLVANVPSGEDPEVSMRNQAVAAFKKLRKQGPLKDARINTCGGVRPIGKNRKGKAYGNLLSLQATFPETLPPLFLETLEARVYSEVVSCPLQPCEKNTKTQLFSHGKLLKAVCQSKPFEEAPVGVKAFPAALDETGVPSFDCEAFVAGAGTGGTLASLALARSGKKVVAVDENHALGGTYIMGYVIGSWHGYKEAIYKQTVDETAAEQVREGTSEFFACTRHFDLAFAQYPQATFLHDSTVCGGTCKYAKKGDAITDALVYSHELGFLRYQPRVVLDASDGMFCKLLGLPGEVGDPFTGVQQTSSQVGRDFQPRELPGAVCTFGDIDVADTTSWNDLNRVISVSMRYSSKWHNAEFYTPRETRRIDGEYRYTLYDIFSRRRFPDTIACVLNTFDNHGSFPTSPIYLNNLIQEFWTDARDFHVRLPLRAYIPRHFANTLSIGKSFSGERDAVCFCRMNSDIMNASYALGLVASAALSSGKPVDFRTQPLQKVQKTLRELKILADWDDQEVSLDEVKSLLKKPFPTAVVPAQLVPWKEVLPVLKQALKRGGEEALNAAGAMLFHGEKVSLQPIRKHLQSLLPQDMISFEEVGEVFRYKDISGNVTESTARTSYGRPATAKIPMWETFNHINTIAGLLSAAGVPEAEDVMLELARRCALTTDHIVRGTTAYSLCRRDMHYFLFQRRMYIIALHFLHHPSARAVKPLQKVLAHYFPQCLAYNLADSTDLRIPFPLPMLAFADLLLSAALAKCGGPTKRLEAYTKDSRLVNARFAQKILKSLDA